MTIPTLEEFDRALHDISQEVHQVASAIYNKAKEEGKIALNGDLNDACSIGSTIMYLDMRKKLYKFFSSIQGNSGKGYVIFVHDNQVSIALEKVSGSQSYEIRNAGYEMLAQRLKQKFGWEIYCDVRID